MVCLTILTGIQFYLNIQFNRHCEGYIKRAADASTIELSKEQLDIAIKYLESNGLTEGYTSIFFNRPGDDIGFWYKNLKTAQNDLESIDSNATSLEKTNKLIKLREILMDHGNYGSEQVTSPSGISIYPANRLIVGLDIFFNLALFFCLYKKYKDYLINFFKK